MTDSGRDDGRPDDGRDRDLAGLVALAAEAVEGGCGSFFVMGTGAFVEAAMHGGSVETRMRSAPETVGGLTRLMRAAWAVGDLGRASDGAYFRHGVQIGLIDLGSVVPGLPEAVSGVRLRVSMREWSDAARLDVQVLRGPDPGAAAGVTTVRALEVVLSRIRMDPQTERVIRSQLAWHREIAAGEAAGKETRR